MNPFTFHKDNLDEVVFEHRNKEYGAYVLRKSYDSNMLKASASSFGFLFMSMGVVYLLSLLHTEIPKIVDPIRITPVDRIISDIEIILDPPADATAAAIKGKVEVFEIEKKPLTPTTPQDPLTHELPSQPSGSLTGVEGGSAAGGEGSQSSSGTGTTITPPVEVTTFETFVSEMPTFNGEMPKYLANQINYPAQARENGIEGKVVISFVVMQDGSINHVQLIKGIGFGCDQEAIRVIESMPRWNAGKQNGKTKAVKMVIPIVFKLQ
jgi:periplasmic protein TonB